MDIPLPPSLRPLLPDLELQLPFTFAPLSSSETLAMAAASSSSAIRIALHRTIASIRSIRNGLEPSVKVGFVPTMGALHEGHLSLVRAARSDNDILVASVFVNPTQFGPGEDLDSYPRQLERDAELLSEFGVDHLFAPDAASMYGPQHVTYVVPEGFDNTAEGKSRPGHFRGVATVVTKLLNIVRPTNAYFGQKDAAQCVLIRRIVEDLNMDTNVVIKDTIREDDGLAMSSRNSYLTLEERQAAPTLYKSLCAARDLFQALADDDSISSQRLQDTITSILESEPLMNEIQYVSIDSKSTMQPMDLVEKSKGAVVSLACKVGRVRLIDNIIL